MRLPRLDKKNLLCMENSGIAVQRSIVRSDTCRIGPEWPSSTQRASSRGLALAKRGLRVKGDVHAWRPGGTNAPMESALHVSTRISCHLAEQPKMLFT